MIGQTQAFCKVFLGNTLGDFTKNPACPMLQMNHNCEHFVAQCVSRITYIVVRSATISSTGKVATARDMWDGVTVPMDHWTLCATPCGTDGARLGAIERALDGRRAYDGSSLGALGRIECADRLRAKLGVLFNELVALAIIDIELLSGDREENVAKIAAGPRIHGW